MLYLVGILMHKKRDLEYMYVCPGYLKSILFRFKMNSDQPCLHACMQWSASDWQEDCSQSRRGASHWSDSYINLILFTCPRKGTLSGNKVKHCLITIQHNCLHSRDTFPQLHSETVQKKKERGKGGQGLRKAKETAPQAYWLIDWLTSYLTSVDQPVSL